MVSRLLALPLAFVALAIDPPPSTAQASRVILVRHAEKVDASRDPDLSVAGMARAMALAAALEEERIDAIVVSQFRRTAMTAAPIARARGVTPRVVPARGTPADYADSVAAAINSTEGTVLVVGHSNTLAPLVARLGGPTIADLCDGEYARMLVLDRRGDAARLEERSYGSPDDGAADECRRTMRLDTTGVVPGPTPGGPTTMSVPVTLRDLVGTWTGENKLWFMPDAPVHESATSATIRTVAGDRYLVIDYTWSHDGTGHDGHLVVRLADDLDPSDMVWVDSFHQSASIMRLAGEAKSATTVTARGSYPAPTGPDWGWKIAVAAEASDRYVMRMWNITPDGQEALAVEAVYRRE